MSPQNQYNAFVRLSFLCGVADNIKTYLDVTFLGVIEFTFDTK